MAGRPHRNLELCDCVGLQFARSGGPNQLLLEDIELLVPAAKHTSITFEAFKEMVLERMNKNKYKMLSVVYRDADAKQSWFIDDEAKFTIFCRAVQRKNAVPVFTVLVKEIEEPPVAKEPQQN